MTWEGPHPGVGREGEERRYMCADRLAGTDLETRVALSTGYIMEGRCGHRLTKLLQMCVSNDESN